MTRTNRWVSLVVATAAVAAAAGWTGLPTLVNGSSRAAASPSSAPVMIRPAVTVAEARPLRLQETRTGVGWVEPLAIVKVRPRLEGIVTDRLVEDGATVDTGAVLLKLDDREIRAQLAREHAALTRERATHARHEDEVRRARELWTRNVGSQARLEQLEGDVRIAAANVALAEAAVQAATVRLDHTIIRAPISGRVGLVKVWPGSLVTPTDSELMTVTVMHPLQVSFALPERDIARLSDVARDTTRRVRVIAAEGGPPVAMGRISFVDSAADPATATILVKAIVAEGSETLWPGQSVRVEVDLGEGPELVSVPVAAAELPRAGSGKGAVFVVDGDGEVRPRQVEVERVEGDRVALRAGLRPGERVAVEGRFRLRDGMSVSIVAPAEAALRSGGSVP